MKKKNILIGIIGFVAFIFIGVVLAGMYKFNVLQDDIYLQTDSGSVVKYNDVVNVTTSIIPIASITKYIGGDYVEVNNLVPAGVSPHNFDLKTNDLVNIEKSDLVIDLGVEGIDGFIEKAISKQTRLMLSEGVELLEHEEKNIDLSDLETLEEQELFIKQSEIGKKCEEKGFKWSQDFSECEGGYSFEGLDTFCSENNGEYNSCESACRNNDKDSDLACIQVCVGVCKFEEIEDSHKEHEDHEDHDEHEEDTHGHDHDHDHGVDNHFWLSPENASAIALQISEQLIELSPDNEVYFQNNYKNFITELESVKNDFVIQNIINEEGEVTQKNFIVFHDAFNYLFNSVGIDQNKKIVFRTNVLSNPDSKELKNIINKIADENIEIIYLEPQFTNSNIDKFISENGLKKYILDPIGTDSSSGGYINNFKNNLESLKVIYE